MFNKAKKVLTKLLTFSFVACCTIGLTMGIAGCDDDNNSANSGNNTTVSVIKEVKQENGKLIIVYTDGRANLEIDLNNQVAACTHENTTVVVRGDHYEEIPGVEWEANGCVALDICTKCGVVSKVASAHVMVATNVTEAKYCHQEKTQTLSCYFCDYEEEDQVVTAPTDHKYAVKYAVEQHLEGDQLVDNVLCEDGGWSIEYCTVCGWINEETVKRVDATDHHSLSWTMTEEPTLTTTGTLTGICNGCDLIVNDQKWTGCGEEVTYTLPAIKTINEATGKSYYTIKDFVQPNCTEAGTATYTITVDGQTFEVEEAKEAGKHSIAINGGTDTEEFTLGGTIYDDDEKYADSWLIFANEEIDCADGANGFFICTNEQCKKPVEVVVKKHHTIDETSIVYTNYSSELDGKDKISYTCDVCGDTDYKEVDHDLEYAFDVVDSVNNIYKVTITCKNGNCILNKVENNVTGVKVDVTDPTCTEKGKTVYTYTDANGKEHVKTVESNMIGHKVDDTHSYFVGDAIDKTTAEAIGINFVAGAEFDCTSDDVGGIFQCKVCEGWIPVAVTVPHVKPAEYTKPTCEVDGSYECAICHNTIGADEDASLAAKGHSFKYSYVTEDDTTYTFSIECTKDADVCGRELGETYRTELYNDTVLKTWVNKVTVDPTCKDKGSITYYVYDKAYIDSETEQPDPTAVLQYTVVVEVATTAHSLNGVVLDPNVVHSFMEGMTWLVTAENQTACNSPEGAAAFFNCTVCDTKHILIKANKPHEMPEGTVLQPATCTTNAYYSYNCAECGTPCRDEVPNTAKGHAISYLTDGYVAPSATTTGKLYFKCTGCTVLNDKYVTLPNTVEGLASGVYTNPVANDAACGTPEFTKYTISAEQMKLLLEDAGVNMAQVNSYGATEIIIQTSAALEHNYTQTLSTWTEEVTESDVDYIVTYTAKYCDVCEKVIVSVVSKVPVVVVTD